MLNDRSIVQIARPHQGRLVEKLNLSVHLGVPEGCEIVCLVRETPSPSGPCTDIVRQLPRATLSRSSAVTSTAAK